MKKRTKLINLDTRTISSLGILSAVSVILVLFIRAPIFAAVPFLEYDPADIPIFLGGFMFGPVAGLILTLIVSVLQGVTVSAGSGIIGILMHFVSTGSFVVVSSLIYQKKRNFFGALLGIISGIIVWTMVMVMLNVLVTPVFMGVQRSVVVSLLLPYIIPFNLIKAGINSAVTLLLYKRVHKLIDYLFRKEKPIVLKSVTHTANSVEETYGIAAEVAKRLSGGEIILMEGDLGAGKTTFTKGLAKALGVEENVTSPTFTIINAYNGRLFKLYHFDMYRISSEEELENLGIRELLNETNSVCVIEWNKYNNLKNVIEISIEVTGENTRKFEIKNL